MITAVKQLKRGTRCLVHGLKYAPCLKYNGKTARVVGDEEEGALLDSDERSRGYLCLVEEFEHRADCLAGFTRNNLTPLWQVRLLRCGEAAVGLLVVVLMVIRVLA